MKMTYGANRWEVISSFHEKDILKSHFFRWDKTLKVWWTKDPAKAAKLLHCADDLAKQAIKEAEQHRIATLEASKAIHSDFSPPIRSGEAYRPFQRAGIEFMVNHREVLQADPMGVGKSLQTIGTLAYTKDFPSFIVCPATVKLVWKDEFIKFFPYKLNIVSLYGIAPKVASHKKKQLHLDIHGQTPALEKKKQSYESWNQWMYLLANHHQGMTYDEDFYYRCEQNIRMWSYDPDNPLREQGLEFSGTSILEVLENIHAHYTVFIANYDIIDSWMPFLISLPIKSLILDEVHSCKNTKSIRGKTSLEISKKYPEIRKVAISGTPFLNRPKELIQPLKILGVFDKLFTSWVYFVNKFCNGQKGKFGWVIDGAQNIPELQQILRSNVMIRREKHEVLPELPTLTWQLLELEATSAQEKRALIEEKKLTQKLKEELERLTYQSELAKALEDDTEYRKAIEKLKKARSVAFNEMARVRYETALAKLDQSLKYIDDMYDGESKTLIFAHHHDIIDKVMDYYGQAAVKLDGRTSEKERHLVIQRFQNDPKILYFVGQIRAAGVGITLTAADREEFLEADWTPGMMNQAAERAQRIGQHNPVLARHHVLEGSLDAVMAKKILQKQRVFEKATEYKHISNAQVSTSEPEEYQTETPLDSANATTNISRNWINETAKHLTTAQKSSIIKGLRILAGMCDKATSLDSMGFSRVDAQLGHNLASQATLSAKQAALGSKLLWKYKKQLPQDIIDHIEPILKKE